MSTFGETFAVSKTKILYNQAPQENSVYICQVYYLWNLPVKTYLKCISISAAHFVVYSSS